MKELILQKNMQLLIGRNSKNDIYIDDNRTSGKHALILFDGQMAVINDIGSTNGTYVNGKKVVSAPLKDNDRIIIGETEIVYIEEKIFIDDSKTKVKINYPTSANTQENHSPAKNKLLKEAVKNNLRHPFKLHTIAEFIRTHKKLCILVSSIIGIAILFAVLMLMLTDNDKPSERVFKVESKNSETKAESFEQEETKDEDQDDSEKEFNHQVSYSPTSGVHDTVVTFEGDGFDASSVTVIFIGELKLIIDTELENSISARIPDDAQTGMIRIVYQDGSEVEVGQFVVEEKEVVEPKNVTTDEQLTAELQDVDWEFVYAVKPDGTIVEGSEGELYCSSSGWFDLEIDDGNVEGEDWYILDRRLYYVCEDGSGTSFEIEIKFDEGEKYLQLYSNETLGQYLLFVAAPTEETGDNTDFDQGNEGLNIDFVPSAGAITDETEIKEALIAGKNFREIKYIYPDGTEDEVMESDSLVFSFYTGNELEIDYQDETDKLSWQALNNAILFILNDSDNESISVDVYLEYNKASNIYLLYMNNEEYISVYASY